MKPDFRLTSTAILVVVLSGCAAPEKSSSRQSTSARSNNAVRESAPQPSKERFVVDIVGGDRAQLPPAKLPDANMYFGSQATYLAGSKASAMNIGGNYIVQVEPPARKPIRITLFGIVDSVTWKINNPEFATVSANGREAFVEFNQADGTGIISVQSGEMEIFRIELRESTSPGKGWQVMVSRINADGQVLDIYGKPTTK